MKPSNKAAVDDNNQQGADGREASEQPPRDAVATAEVAVGRPRRPELGAIVASNINEHGKEK